jgi:transcriptional regulator with XRE-family HTH domain
LAVNIDYRKLFAFFWKLAIRLPGIGMVMTKIESPAIVGVQFSELTGEKAAEVGGDGGRINLGARLRRLRREKGWTIGTAAERTGLARSTLSKIENNQMSPTFDVLQKLAIGLATDVGALVSTTKPAPVLGRRSMTRAGNGRCYKMPNYEHEFLCAELAQRKFTPIRTRIRARSIGEFPEWVRHAGEDFVFVLDGEIELHTEFYQPVRLGPGDSVYFDAQMGHAVISVSPMDATILWVTSR